MRGPTLILVAFATATIWMVSLSSNRAEAIGIYGPVGLCPALDELDPLGSIRCCAWGPRGWYDTWRNCQFCESSARHRFACASRNRAR
jgi:hypothetical protein